MRWIVLVLGAWLALCGRAGAQAGGLAIDLYGAAETSEDGFAISRPADLGHLRFRAQLAGDYGLAPLVLADTGAAAAPQLVSHLVGLRAGLALGLIDRVVVFASLPVVALMEGEQAPGGVPLARGGGVGDPTLGARVRLVGEPADVGAVALQLTGSVPLAEGIDASQDLIGEGGVTFAPEVLGEVRIDFVRITANLGLLFRTAPTFTNLAVEHELTWGLGVGATFLDELLEARLEAYGRVGLADPGAAQGAPAEAILGLRLRPIEGLVLGLAGGPGLGTGYGTPAFRGVLSVGWSGEADGDARRFEDARAEQAAAEAARRAREAADAAARAGGGGRGGAGGAADATGTGGGTAAGAAAPGDRAAGSAATDVARPAYEQLDRDGDRVVDAADHCPIDREDFDEIQDEDGCPEEDADADLVADLDDQCPLTPGRVARGECNGCPELACVVRGTGAIEITQRVEFDSGAATILASSEAVLRDVLSIVSTNDQIVRLRIEGHTDDRGNDEANLDLSVRRAAAVVAWLVERGIARERLSGFGCGETAPLVPGTSPRARARNRRVEFLIVEPPSPRPVREGCRPAP